MQFTWDLTHLYPNDALMEDDQKRLEEKIKLFQKIYGTVLDSPQDFLKVTDLLYEIKGLNEKIYCYNKRHFDKDITQKKYEQNASKALTFYDKILSLNTSYNNILIADKDKALKYSQNTIYARQTNLILNNANHLLPEDIAKVYYDLNYLLTFYENTFNSVYFKDAKRATVTINSQELQLDIDTFNYLMQSPHQKVRKKAFKAFYQDFANIQNTLATLWENKIAVSLKKAQLENYSSLKEKILQKEELPLNLIDNLIKCVHKNLNLNHQYILLRKKTLNLENYYIYDNFISISTIPKIEYDIKEGISLLKQAFKILGPDYLKVIDKAFKEGWIDLYARPTKRNMSYSCISYYGAPYASISYDKSLLSLKQLAHELGHSIHTYFAKTQPFVNFEYSLFAAEITSKVNEILLYEYLIKTSLDKNTKIYLLNEMLTMMSNTLFDNTLTTEFEDLFIQSVTNKEIISASKLNNTYATLYYQYTGKAMSQDEIVKYLWMKQNHYWQTEEFYDFKYVTGLSIAICIAHDLMNNTLEASKYLDFLKIGNSLDINKSLAKLGINLKSYDYLDKAFKLFFEKLNLLEELLASK